MSAFDQNRTNDLADRALDPDFSAVKRGLCAISQR